MILSMALVEYLDSSLFFCTPTCSVWGITNSVGNASAGFVKFSFSRTGGTLFLFMGLHRADGNQSWLKVAEGEIYLQVVWT